MPKYPSEALSFYTELIFEHEDKFLEKFCKGKACQYDLDEVFFAEKSIKFNYTHYDGQHFTDTLPVSEFLKWVDEVQPRKWCDDCQNSVRKGCTEFCNIREK
jgi:hypothetical protein